MKVCLVTITVKIYWGEITFSQIVPIPEHEIHNFQKAIGDAYNVTCEVKPL